jgi:radical SAM protein with 4Fe4S-binding SPASM domain
MKDYNSTLNHEEFLQKKIILESRPRMLFLELTRSCNLTCPMCRPELMAGHQFDMSEKVLNALENQLFPYIECIDLRAFGESTLDNRLFPLYKKAQTMGVKVNLYTNLVTRSAQYWREMGQYKINIAISLEAATEALYNEQRRGGTFKKFLINLEALSKARQESKHVESIYFSVTVSAENIQELPGLVRLAAQYGIKTIRLNPISKESPGSNYPAMGLEVALHAPLDASLSEALQIAAVHQIQLEMAASLTNEEDGGFDLCVHPWSYVVCSYDGDIIFCDHLIADKRAVMGNLLKDDFLTIWNNEAYQRIRKEHLRKDFERLKKCGIECDWCYKNRYADVESDFEPQYMPKTLHSTDYVPK